MFEQLVGLVIAAVVLLPVIYHKTLYASWCRFLTHCNTSKQFIMTSSAHCGYTAIVELLENNNYAPTWLALPMYPYTTYVIGDPADVKEVLKSGSPYVKSQELRDQLAPVFGHSLLNENTSTQEESNEVYAQKRDIMDLIKESNKASLIEQVVNIFMSEVREKAKDGSAFNLLPMIEALTFSFMLGVVFKKSLGPDEKKFKLDVDELLTRSGKQMNLPLYGWTGYTQDAAEKCDAYIREFLKLGEWNGGCKHPVDMFRGMALAGYATVTALLGSTIRDVGDAEGKKWQREVANAADDSEAREMTTGALRKSGAQHPPVGALVKVAGESNTLPSGVHIKAGQTVIVTLVSKDPAFDTLFSLGPRACTGRVVAMELLSNVLAKLLSEFEVEVTSANYKQLSMLWELENLEVVMRRREVDAAN